MSRRALGFLVIAHLVALLVWLATMIGIAATIGMPRSFHDSLTFVATRDWFSYDVCYANAVLLTVLGVMVWAGLYRFLRKELGFWAEVGFVFIPIYGIIALFSYVSQLVIVPGLVADTSETSAELLRHLMHIWPESSLQNFDQFAYFLLGITSFVFGIGLARKSGALRVSGWLFVLGGPLTLAIGVGVLLGWTQVVGGSSMAGGVLSIVAEVALAIGLLRPEIEAPRRMT